MLRNYFLSVEADEAPGALHAVRRRNLVFSTDIRMRTPISALAESFLELPLGDSSKRRILWTTRKLYNPAPLNLLDDAFTWNRSSIAHAHQSVRRRSPDAAGASRSRG